MLEGRNRVGVVPECSGADLFDHVGGEDCGLLGGGHGGEAASQAGQRCAAEGVAGAGGVNLVSGVSGDGRDGLALDHQRAAFAQGDEKQFACCRACRVDRAKQAVGFVFVHEEEIGLFKQSAHGRCLVVDDVAVRAGRDAWRAALPAAVQKVDLALRRSQRSNVDKAIARQIVGEIGGCQQRFGAPSGAQERCLAAAVVGNLQAGQLFGVDDRPDPGETRSGWLQELRQRVGSWRQQDHGCASSPRRGGSVQRRAAGRGHRLP